MNKILFILFLFISLHTSGQVSKNRYAVWVIPSIDTRINGLSVGLMINSVKSNDSILTTIVNGVNTEIIGVGFFLPLVPSSPIYFEDSEFYEIIENVDSIIRSYDYVKYKINGLNFSLGGLGGHDIHVNGINLSGINTLTGKTNGISACALINITAVANGISFAVLINNTMQTKGLQIGLFNETKKLRGIQIGLWNKNEKRNLPIINWNFSNYPQNDND